MTGSRKLFPFKFHTLGPYSREAVRCVLALGLEAEAPAGLVPGVQGLGSVLRCPSQAARVDGTRAVGGPFGKAPAGWSPVLRAAFGLQSPVVRFPSRSPPPR